MHPDDPLIIQSDRTVLAEVESHRFAEVRPLLARFAEPLNLKNAMDSAKGHASVVDSELSSMFRAHPLGEFEKRNRMGRMMWAE